MVLLKKQDGSFPTVFSATYYHIAFMIYLFVDVSCMCKFIKRRAYGNEFRYELMATKIIIIYLLHN
jgi:hypothetical protein